MVGGDRCGRSVTQSTLQSESVGGPRTCRRSRQSRSSRRIDGGAGTASTAPRSVSSHARSRCADDDRTTGTCFRTGPRRRSRDRSSTVDHRRRHVWNAIVDDGDNSSTQPAANSELGGRSGPRWNTLCVSPSDNSILTVESGCGFINRRRVLATTPITPSTPAPDNLHAATLGNIL